MMSVCTQYAERFLCDSVNKLSGEIAGIVVPNPKCNNLRKKERCLW